MIVSVGIDVVDVARFVARTAAGTPLADVLARVEREVVPNAAWLHAPAHMAHQLSCPLPSAIWAEPLVAALNQSLAVAELSPAATAIERRVLRWYHGIKEVERA